MSAPGACRPLRPRRPLRQRGSAMIEFIVVAPLLTLLGLGILQYGLLFFAKNQMNHAAFMAARAGSMGHASVEAAQSAYIRAMVPMYGGGRNTVELVQSLAKAKTDIEAFTQIELLNPTRQSFEDWNDPQLQATVGKGKAKGGADARVISNSGLAMRFINVGPSSGQSSQDANLIKLRITQGYEPKVPLINKLYTQALAALDSKTDPHYSALLAAGRIPVANVVTLQMQSDAIEPDHSISSPGPGNNGTPVDPNPPEIPAPSPIPGDPPQTPAPGDPPPVPACDEGVTLIETVASDVLFEFDRAVLNDAGRQQLNALIEQSQQRSFESLTLTGYTDPLGNAAHNDPLSLARAAAVRDYLRSHGFPDKPITVQGKGARDPAATVV